MTILRLSEFELTKGNFWFLIRGGERRGVDAVSLAMRKIPGVKRIIGVAAEETEPTVGRYIAPQNSVVADALLRIGFAWKSVGLATDKLADQATRPFELAEALKTPCNPPLITGMRRLMDHQARAVAAIGKLGNRALLADDMGLGKSATAIACVRTNLPFHLLIVCPVSVKYNWVRELELSGISEANVMVIDGPPKRREKLFAKLGDAPVVIINYDLLRYLQPSQFAKLQQFVAGQFLILDESHYVKDRKSDRTKFVNQLNPKDILLLTGTPVRNTIADLYSQLMLISPGLWTSFWEFQDRYLVMGELRLGNRKVKQVVGTKNIEQLNALVNHFQIRRKKEELGGLPPKMTTVHELVLDDDTRPVYEAMRDMWLYQFKDLADDTPIFHSSAQSALESALRLEQLAQGFIGGVPEEIVKKVSKQLAKAVAITGRDREIAFPNAAKFVWLTELIDSLLIAGRRPVVWFKFNGPMFYLLQANKWPSLALHGGLIAKQKHEAIEAFQSGAAQVFLGQVKMAEGFNLTCSTDVIFFGRDWSPAANAQAEDRCHRIGQTGMVNIHIPVVRNSVEWGIHKKLAAKSADAEGALKTLTIGELREMMGS